MSQGRQIYTSNHQQIEFSCSYSLATQTVSTQVDVFGKDMVMSRSKSGNLVFEMIAGSSVNIGARHPFSIVPKTPGAVYYTARNCKVQTVDELQSYGLIYDDGNGQCLDDVTDVSLESNLGWSTDQRQDFSYNAFKFSSPGSRDGMTSAESQKISCDIHLSMEIDSSYKPFQCGLSSRCAAMECTCYEADGVTCCSNQYEDNDKCVSAMTLVDENGITLDGTPRKLPQSFDMLKHNEVETEIKIADETLQSIIGNLGRKRRDAEDHWGDLFFIKRAGATAHLDTEDCGVSVSFNSLTAQFRLTECVGDRTFISDTGSILDLVLQGRSIFAKFNKFSVGKEKRKGVEYIYVKLNGKEYWSAPTKDIPEGKIYSLIRLYCSLYCLSYQRLEKECNRILQKEQRLHTRTSQELQY